MNGLWSCDLVADVPGIQVAVRRILKPRPEGHEQVVMLVEIIDGANVKSGGGLGGGDVGAAEFEGSGLVEYFGTDGQLTPLTYLSATHARTGLWRKVKCHTVSISE